MKGNSTTFRYKGPLQDLRRQLTAFLSDALEELTVQTAALEVDELLESLLGLRREALLLQGALELTEEQSATLHDLVARRCNGEPLAYLTGEKEFYSRPFFVTPDVLIPRPETEGLVEKAFERIRSYQGSSCAVLDVGTGSGAILLSLALECREKLGERVFEKIRFIGVDVSAEALLVAKRNALRHTLDSAVSFVRGDLLTAFSVLKCSSTSCLILSNPPYIAEGTELPRSVYDFEPSLALFSGPDGLDAIRGLLQQALDMGAPAEDQKAAVLPETHLLFELGYDQALEVESLLRKSGLANYSFYQDLQGITRLVEVSCQKSCA